MPAPRPPIPGGVPMPSERGLRFMPWTAALAPRRRRRGRVGRRLLLVAVAVAAFLVAGVGAAAAAKPAAAPPNFGPNVLIFDPSMPTSHIQSAVDAIAAQQVPNQFGPERYALLFKPGTYGTAQAPLNFQVGYYTSVAGLGLSPGDVNVNGSIYVRNQCD